MYNRLERIKELHRRLDMVIIENLSYEKVIDKYDTKSNFFYCDPPYMLDTPMRTAAVQHEALRDILKSIKGRFILSYDDNLKSSNSTRAMTSSMLPETKGINRKEGKPECNEVIIANFQAGGTMNSIISPG
jgi:DNA adenine methylase